MAKSATNYDVNQWIEQLKKCEYIKESEVKALTNRAKEILLEESNVQIVESPVTVSIHLFPLNKFLNRSVATFMASFTISWSSFRSEASVRTPITYSWGTSLTEGTTQSRPSYYYWL